MEEFPYLEIEIVTPQRSATSPNDSNFADYICIEMVFGDVGWSAPQKHIKKDSSLSQVNNSPLPCYSYEMAFSSEYERARYSHQLAEHTLRQFSAARVSPDSTARLPPSHSQKLARLLGV